MGQLEANAAASLQPEGVRKPEERGNLADATQGAYLSVPVRKMGYRTSR
jgi:hypothetical protein